MPSEPLISPEGALVTLRVGRTVGKRVGFLLGMGVLGFLVGDVVTSYSTVVGSFVGDFELGRRVGLLEVGRIVGLGARVGER